MRSLIIPALLAALVLVGTAASWLQEAGASRSGPPAAGAVVASPAGPERPAVLVYTTSWCGWCRKTLAWLEAEDVPYVNKDIERDPGHRAELVRKTGRTSIPVVEIDGALVQGFDPRRMRHLLGS